MNFAPILSKAQGGDCNPLFFKPNDHSADKSYLEHMNRGQINHSYLMEFSTGGNIH